MMRLIERKNTAFERRAINRGQDKDILAAVDNGRMARCAYQAYDA